MPTPIQLLQSRMRATHFDAGWEEAKHPRGHGGQFAHVAGADVKFNEHGIVHEAPKHKHLVGKTLAQVEQHGKAPEKKAGYHPIERNAAGAYAGSNPEHAERIKGLKLPPGWTGVHLSEDPDAAVQATGKDAKGRTVYKRSAKATGESSKAKFARWKKFGGILPSIRAHIADHPSEEAAALRLIDKHGLRIGGTGNTKAEKQAYGATTLQSEHVHPHESGSGVRLKFTGKKGVDLNLPITEESLANDLQERAKNGGKLYNTTDAKVRDFLHGIAPGFKVKDFRTNVAAETALDSIKAIPAPTDAKSLSAAIKRVSEKVSAKLGNTPKIALDSYIPPEVFTPWLAKVANLQQASLIQKFGESKGLPAQQAAMQWIPKHAAEYRRDFNKRHENIGKVQPLQEASFLYQAENGHGQVTKSNGRSEARPASWSAGSSRNGVLPGRADGGQGNLLPGSGGGSRGRVMGDRFSAEEPSLLEKLNARRNPPRPEPIHRTFADMHVIIENPKGSTRNGTDRRGKKWSQKMNHDYGHLAKTTGADGEGVDAFLGGNEKAPNVHIIHTNDPYTGHYDEDKAMVGFDSPEQAKAAFLSNYDRPEHYRSTTIMPIESFKSALHKGIAGSVRWKRKNKRPLESAAIFSADTPMTPIQKLQHRMRANQVQNFAAEDEAGAEWRTFPSEMESDGKRHGGSPHLIRPSDGMILDEKDGKPGVLHGKTIGQLKERSQAKKADSPAKTPTGRPQPLALAKPREMSSHEQQAHDIMNPGDLVGSTPVVGGKLGTFQPAQPGQPGQQPGQPPAPTHPPLTPEALAEEFKTLHAANKDSRGLPAHTLREHIGQKYGSEAASHEQLDPMLKAMRGKQLRLTSGGHMFNRPEVGAVNQTPEQTAQGIHGAVDPYTGAQETFTHISPQLSPEEQLAEGEKKRTALQQHPHLDLATGQPIPAPPPPPTPVEQQQVAAQTAQHNAPPVAPSPAVGQPLATGEVRPQIPQQTPFPVPPNAPAEAPKTQPTGSASPASPANAAMPSGAASPGMQSPSAPPAPQTQPMVPETAGVNAPDLGMTANPPSTVPPQHHEHIGKMLDLQHKIMDHLAKPAAELAPDDEPWGPSVESTPMGEGRGQAEMDRMGKELAGGAPEQSAAAQPEPETTPPAATPAPQTPAPAPQQASKPTPPVKQTTSEQFNAKRKEYDAAVAELGLPPGSASAQPVKTKPQAPAENVIPAKTAPASATSAPRQSPTLATRDKIAARKKPLQKLQDRMKPKDTRIGSPLSQAHERPYKYPGVDAIYKLDNSSDAPVEMVDPKTLLSHQPYLHSDVASRIKGDIHRPLVIVRHNGKDYIEEGNHRAAHAMREGKHVPAKVIHVGEPPKPKEAPDVGTSVRGESAPEDSAPVAPLPNDAGNEPQGGGSVPVPPAAEPAAPQPASAPAQAGVERSAPRQEDVNQLQARIRDLKEKHATAKSSRIAKSIERDIARNEAELAKMQPTSAPSPRESLDAADKAKTRMDAAVDAVRRFKPSPTNMDEQNRLESEAARAKADFEKSRSSIGSGVLSRVGQSPATETATTPLKPGQLYPGDMTTEEWNQRQANQKAGQKAGQQRHEQRQGELKGLAGIKSRIKAVQGREAGAKSGFTPEQQKNMEFERRKREITEQGAGGASRPAAERAKTYQRQGNSGVTSPTKLNQVGGITAGKPDDSGQHPNAKYLKDQPKPAGVMPEPEVAPMPPGVSPGTRSLQKRIKGKGGKAKADTKSPAEQAYARAQEAHGNGDTEGFARHLTEAEKHASEAEKATPIKGKRSEAVKNHPPFTHDPSKGLSRADQESIHNMAKGQKGREDYKNARSAAESQAIADLTEEERNKAGFKPTPPKKMQSRIKPVKSSEAGAPAASAPAKEEKAPKADVGTATSKIKDLYGRAASLTNDEFHKHSGVIDGLKKADLVKVAESIGLAGMNAKSATVISSLIKNRIIDRMGQNRKVSTIDVTGRGTPSRSDEGVIPMVPVPQSGTRNPLTIKKPSVDLNSPLPIRPGSSPESEKDIGNTKSLYERAISLNKSDLDNHAKVIAGMGKPDLVAAAERIGLRGMEGKSRPVIAAQIMRRISDRMGQGQKTAMIDVTGKPEQFSAYSDTPIGRLQARMRRSELAYA